MKNKNVIKSVLSSFIVFLGIQGVSNTASANEAIYEVVFMDRWNAQDHLAFPSNAHYSPLVALNHNANYRLFMLGGFATPGFEQLAETGGTRRLMRELAQAQQMGAIDHVVQTEALFPHRDGRVMMFHVRVTTSHPYLSFATMIAPSPDWILGADSLSLIDENGNFVDQQAFYLYAVNAGTETGDFGGNFSISNPASSPHEPISTLMDRQGLNSPFASVMIRRMR